MGFNDVLKKLFGNKAQRDLKEIEPYVGRIKEAYEKIKTLSNDELRDRTDAIKQQIQDYVKAERDRIATLRGEIETTEINRREKIYDEIDRLEKEILEKYEQVLEEVLPEVFAIVKDTARRFTENAEVVVTANDFDRDLAAKHDFVFIEGDQAHYKNEWTAGGNLLKWEMVHYDVQLFGGVVLHKGKIAEMATGKVRHSWLPYPYSSTHLRETAYTW